MQLGATISLDDAIALGVSAAPIPADKPLSDAELLALRQKYAAAGITPVQTNGYCNLVATDEAVRLENIAATRELLRKADLAGSRAVVVGGGHRDAKVPRDVFSAHPDNWKPETVELLAKSCRAILDGLDLKTVKLTIETWVMTPLDSPQAVKRLVELVDHPNFGILFDPVNMMNLERHFRSGPFIAECFAAFGDAIVLVHAKDTGLQPEHFTYKMAEVPIGTGQLDYNELLRQMATREKDLPLVIEHLGQPEEYAAAVRHLRGIAAAEGLSFWVPGRG